MNFSAAAAARARRIQFLLLDVDGVLTDGRIIYLPGVEGDEAKAFDSKDGVGIRLAQKMGLEVGLLSGRRSSVVERRARELDIHEVLQGCFPKMPAYEDLLIRHGIEDAQVCYIGDDIVDVPILRRAGLSATVADAHPQAVKAAHVVSSRPGGRGAVREIVDGLVLARGCWDEVVAPLLQ